ncbi:MAG TPA: hypothetical protein VNM90_01755 [Haliangium sp.]|nr:hypothetical protein [Haliangium sp.]
MRPWARTRARLALAIAVAAGAVCARSGGAGLARAQEVPITDRDYAIDSYQGPVLGSARILGMGGAVVALAEGSATMLVNPASPAVRRATSTDEWDWDWHLDWLDSSSTQDYDNDGRIRESELAQSPLVTLGVVGQLRAWAVGIGGLITTRTITLDTGERLTPSILIGRLVVARSFDERRVTVGLGLRTANFDLVRASGGAEDTLFALANASLEAGVVWQPADRNLRVGATAALPVVARDGVTTCDPESCAGYILPRAVSVPWEASAGVAWRRARTRWNQVIQAPFRDERSLIVSGDVVLTGATRDGHAFEAFLDKTLQPSGRAVSVSVRAGAEYEWLPGRLRVRGGSYWEPGRITGADGRLHVTGGLEWRIWQVSLWRKPYRLQVGITGDLARDYGNGGLSVGLWH